MKVTLFFTLLSFVSGTFCFLIFLFFNSFSLFVLCFILYALFFIGIKKMFIDRIIPYRHLENYDSSGIYLYFTQMKENVKRTNGKVDAQGIPLYKINGEWEHHFVQIAHCGLQQYSYYIASNRMDQHGLDEAIRCADWLCSQQNQTTGGFEVPYTWAEMNEKNWISALTQGAIMSLLSRVYLTTLNNKYLECALLSCKPFTVPVEDGGVLRLIDGHKFYEEYPSGSPTLVLNGFVFALLGLYDVYTMTNDEGVHDLFLDGVKCLKRLLPLYDTGDSVMYKLDFIFNSAKTPFVNGTYAVVHISLLEAIRDITGDGYYDNFISRWRIYSYLSVYNVPVHLLNTLIVRLLMKQQIKLLQRN